MSKREQEDYLEEEDYPEQEDGPEEDDDEITKHLKLL